MRRLWKDYEDAIQRLNESAKDKFTRNEATELLGISSGVFAREIRCNSMFIAMCEPEITSTATYYSRKDLIAHFERLRDEAEPALLIYRRHTLSDEEFESIYHKTKDRVFEVGTNLTVGGEN